MAKNDKNKRSDGNNHIFRSLVFGILTFSITLFALRFPYPLAAMLAIAMYFSVFYLTKKKVRFAGKEIDSSLTQEEVNSMVRNANYHIATIDNVARNSNSDQVCSKARILYQTTMSIISYVQNNPSKIIQAKDFLTNKLNQVGNILQAYLKTSFSNIDENKQALLDEEILKQIDLFNLEFQNEFEKLVK